MFIDLDKQTHPINFAGIYLRYDNKAMLKLEKAGIDLMCLSGFISVFEVFSFMLKTGLDDYFSSNYITDTDDIISSVMCAIPPMELQTHVLNAVKLAFPAPVIGAKTKSSRINLALIKSAFCGVMGKSESEFWNLTLREVMERWEPYAEFMGYTKPVPVVQEFDDE